MDSRRNFLRHTVATLAYRGGKAVRAAPEGFAAARACATSRSAAEVLAHIGDLLDWCLSMAKGPEVWRPAAPRGWEAEVERFFKGLRSLDDFLAGDTPLATPPEKLFQRPIADALTQALRPAGVGVVLEAEHLCIAVRGVKKPGSKMVTSATRGAFRAHQATRLEFLSLIGKG